MRVLVIPSWYPYGEDKLMGIYHKEYVEALNKYGVSADMLFIARERISKPFKYIKATKIEKINEKNYLTYIIKMLDTKKINYNLMMRAYVKRLEKGFKEYIKDNPKPDILHAMVSVPAGYAATKLGEKYNIPVVVTEHGGLFERQYTDKKYEKYGNYVIKHAYMTVVSKFLQQKFNNYIKDVPIIPNQVDIHLFKNNINRQIGKTLHLVTICAIRNLKGLEVTFKALQSLKDKINVHLDIIGSGYMEEHYKKLCTDMGLDDTITFLGMKTKEEIAEILTKEHILVMASEIESFGIPAIEALASGMPVVATDSGGPKEIIDEKCGTIVKVNDAQELEKGILEVYKDYNNYDKSYLESIAAIYSEEEITKKAKEIYENVLTKEQ